MVVTKQYIAEAMGKRYVDFPPLNLENTHAESTERVPFVCILSSGSDPTDLIMLLAKKRKTEVLSVSMGQGQEVVARRFVDQGSVSGCWALFQNCHLGLKFLEELELRLGELDDGRLFLHTQPQPWKLPSSPLLMKLLL